MADDCCRRRRCFLTDIYIYIYVKPRQSKDVRDWLERERERTKGASFLESGIGIWYRDNSNRGGYVKFFCQESGDVAVDRKTDFTRHGREEIRRQKRISPEPW